MEQQLAQEVVAEALRTVRPLVVQSRDGLVLTALEWAPAGLTADAGYETATAAAAAGDLELREQGGGTVPAIEAVTKTKPVVIFAGDSVVGGKQNRIINITVWLPAASVTAIPVSCLEMGRWNQGHRFETSRKVDYLLRAEMSRQMADVAVQEEQIALRRGPAGMAAPRSFQADQGDVWSSISAKELRAGRHSPSSALHDLYAAESMDIAAFSQAFPCPTGASGVAVGIGGVLVALELFDAPSTLAEQWPRLVEGAASAYADHRRAVAAGMTEAPRHRYPDEGAVSRMLARAVAAAPEAVAGKSVGEGVDLRLAGHKIRGGALVVNNRPVHVELFRVPA